MKKEWNEKEIDKKRLTTASFVIIWIANYSNCASLIYSLIIVLYDPSTLLNLCTRFRKWESDGMEEEIDNFASLMKEKEVSNCFICTYLD